MTDNAERIAADAVHATALVDELSSLTGVPVMWDRDPEPGSERIALLDSEDVVFIADTMTEFLPTLEGIVLLCRHAAQKKGQ